MKTDAKGTPKRTPKRTPRGFTLTHRPGRPLPYGVRWRSATGRHSRQFATEGERDNFIRALASQGKEARKELHVLPPSEAARWEEFRRLTNNADLLEVGRFWAERHRPLPLGEAVERYIAAVSGRKVANDTATHRALHLGRLVAALGAETNLSKIGAAEIRGWLASLVLDGRPASPASRRHHRANANRLWAWLRAEGLTPTSFFDAVPVDEAEDSEINLLTVDEGRHLLEVNQDHPSAPRLALEAFAGLRFTSAQRLGLEDINFADRGITLPGAKHKSGRRHYIDGLPGNVWDWLALAKPATWTVAPRMYAIHKAEMFKAAGFTGERFRNVLRHSFASYHCAAYKNPGLTASLLTHRGQDVLWKHYRGRAKESDGAAWFQIVPAPKTEITT